MVVVALISPYPRETSIHAACMTAILSIYPLAKRLSDYPQVLLGFGLSMPVFLCCSILGSDGILQSNQISSSPVSSNAPDLILAELSLYGAGVLWTIIFDTVYAHQDAKDDRKAGVRSLAVRLGQNTKPVLALLACLQVVLLVGAGLLFDSSVGSSLAYYVLGCGGTAISLAAMIARVRLDNAASCAWWFGPGSRFVGLNVTLGLFGTYLGRS